MSEIRNMVHGGPREWRAPNPHTNQETGDFDDRAFRTCDYCGSIHPMDLLAVIKSHSGLRDPASLQEYDVSRPLRHFALRLDMADWKYGWPHKFYVEGIPSPLRGQMVCRSKRYVNGVMVAQDFRHEPPTAESHAKFYTTHLSDLDPEPFVELSREIWRRSDLCFVRPSLREPAMLGWRRTAYREVEDPKWFLEAQSFELKSV